MKRMTRLMLTETVIMIPLHLQQKVLDVVDDVISTIHTASAAMQSDTASVEPNVVRLDMTAKYPTDRALFTRNVSN